MSTNTESRDTIPDAASAFAAGVLALHDVTGDAVTADVAGAIRVAAEHERERLARYLERCAAVCARRAAGSVTRAELQWLFELMARDVREGSAR